MGRENYKKERKGSKAGGPPTATTENNGWPREEMAFRGEDNIARVLELCHGEGTNYCAEIYPSYSQEVK